MDAHSAAQLHPGVVALLLTGLDIFVEGLFLRSRDMLISGAFITGYALQAMNASP